MKTYLRSYLTVLLGLFAFTCVMGQKTSQEYDDMYYIPSEKKVVQSADTQTPATQQQATQTSEPSDYEKYIQNLEKQRSVSKVKKPGQTQNQAVEYSNDSVEYAEDQNYLYSDDTQYAEEQ